MTRKIVQIVAGFQMPLTLYALCDDSSVWWVQPGSPWARVLDIPQDEPGRPPAPEPEEPDPDMDLKASELDDLLTGHNDLTPPPDSKEEIDAALRKWRQDRGLV